RSTCLSHLRCDQWLNGEIDDDAVTAHLASCERCTARIAAHRRERAAFAVPLRVPQRSRRWMTVVASAAAALGVWLAWPRRDDPATRDKGRSSIGFYVKHGELVRRGAAGEIVAPRDAINFTASTDRAAYLAIVSVDGAGKVSAYYPDGPTAAALPAGRD